MSENRNGLDHLKRIFLVAVTCFTVVGTCRITDIGTVAASVTETMQTATETETESTGTVTYTLDTEAAEETEEVVEPETEAEPEAEAEPELPAYTVEDVQKTLYVTKSCNIRKGPSTDYEVIGSYGLNQEAAVTGQASTGWYRIDYNGNEGFISNTLLADAPVVIEEPQPQPQEPQPQPEEPQPQPEAPQPQQTGRTPIAMNPAPSAGEQAAINAILSQIVTPDMDDFAVATAINNYLCAKAEYDYTYQHRSAYDCMVNGTGVCQGYANAFWRLMNAAGIPTDYISGQAFNGVETGSHGWNRSLINGAYYYTDVTWNDTCGNAYLLMSYEQISQDHWEQRINPYRVY